MAVLLAIARWPLTTGLSLAACVLTAVMATSLLHLSSARLQAFSMETLMHENLLGAPNAYEWP